MARQAEQWRWLLSPAGTAVFLWALGSIGGLASPAQGEPAPAKPAAKDSPPKAGKDKLGLLVNDPRAFQGYTLFSGLFSTKTYLIDMQGRVVRTWESGSTPALTPYLLENGHLLRPGTVPTKPQAFGGPGSGGRIQEFTWEGQPVWDFKFSDDKRHPHHDVTRLPSGNVLMIVWDKKAAKEAVAAGRRPDSGSDHLLPDSLVEIKPTGKTTGEVVWEWHLWDHLVQDFDKTKANYGDVAAHPELVDVNFSQDMLGPMLAKKDGIDKLKSIGYLGNAAGKGPTRINPDWTHFNGVAYNPELDQVAVSVHGFSEVWVIDHGTSSAEAAGHTGGRCGKGGDLLYRWGNPRAYRAGTEKDQRLFAQHNAHWVPKGLPGEGHLLVFNNGNRRPDGTYSSVDEVVLPAGPDGRYEKEPGKPFGPDLPVWSYTASKKTDFYSMLISGAQRLANGNTLICSGVNGTVFEVTPAKETVWKYANPIKGGPGGPGMPPGGPGRFGGPPPDQGVQVLPGFLQDILGLSSDQKKQLDEFRKEVATRLDRILTDEQKKQQKEPRGGFGGFPQPGQLMTPFQQARLKLTGDQKKKVADLQKEVDAKLEKTFTDEQKKKFKEMRDGFARGGAGGGPPGGAGGPPMFFGGPSGSSLFRAYRYGPDYPGLVGKELSPGKTVEELEAKAEPKKDKKPDASKK